MNNAYDFYDQLIKTSLLLGDGDRQFFSHYGLTPVRYYALKHIHQDPGLSLSDLSTRLLCTKGNATRILRDMEFDGLIDRAPDPQDQRAYRLLLTDQGRDLFEIVRAAYLEFNQKRFDCYSSQQLSEMLAEITVLNTYLQKHLRD